jgi:hypothetical protein
MSCNVSHRCVYRQCVVLWSLVVVSAPGMCVSAPEMCCLGHNVVSLWGRTYNQTHLMVAATFGECYKRVCSESVTRECQPHSIVRVVVLSHQWIVIKFTSVTIKFASVTDDTQTGNPNKTPERVLFGITQVRGRL